MLLEQDDGGGRNADIDWCEEGSDQTRQVTVSHDNILILKAGESHCMFSGRILPQ